MKKPLQVIKSSGYLTDFIPEKLVSSLMRAGASPELAQLITQEVSSKIYDGVSTSNIYKKAYSALKKRSRKTAGKYHLKRAIMELGPSGYPFEKFVGELLRREGFSIQVGVVVEGHCISHEIDVIAERMDHHYMVECKYHNQPGISCDVKVPLYIYSRFKDVERRWLELPGHAEKFHQPWVVTNTKFTIDAIRYGECMNMRLIGWNYPAAANLRTLIHKLNLFPLTCVTSLTRAEKQQLLDRGYVTCEELLHASEAFKELHIEGTRLKRIIEELQNLVGIDL